MGSVAPRAVLEIAAPHRPAIDKIYTNGRMVLDLIPSDLCPDDIIAAIMHAMRVKHALGEDAPQLG